MRYYIIPAANDGWVAVTLPTGKESLIETDVMPYLQKSGFSDFGFWPALIALAAAVASAIKNRGAKITQGIAGFARMNQSLIVHGLTTKGQFLFCSDDCGKSWRITLNGSGHISISERGYAPVGAPVESGNVRFDCATLAPELLSLISCTATLNRAHTMGAGGEAPIAKQPTAGVGTWIPYVLLGVLGLVILLSVGGGSSRKARTA